MPAITLGRSCPFLLEQADLLPAGDIAFLGAGGAAEIVHLARMGYRITVFEADSSRLNETRDQLATSGVSAQWHLAPCASWRLGFERWGGVIAVFPRWSLAEQRRLLRQVPCALKLGGSFLFEGLAEAPCGPTSLANDEHDPEEFRCALDVLHLARCTRVFRPAQPGSLGPQWILQVLGSHLEADDEAAEPVAPQCTAAKAASRRALSASIAGTISRPSRACAAPYSAR